MNKDNILVEKWRPKTFDEVLGLPTEIKGLVNDRMPHMLFYGTPGTGKTSTAKIIIKTLGCDSITLNASDERGIDVIREKVKSFAMTQNMNSKFRIVFLDECDALTKDAQNSLRNLMETFSANCRFLLSCNHINKVEPALQSRCSVYEFKMPKGGVKERLKYIAEQENIILADGVLEKIVEVSKNDIRKCVNILQQLQGLNRHITIQDVKASSDIVEKVHQLLIKQDFLTARQILLDANVEYDQFLVDYHDYLMLNVQILGTPKVANCIIIIADSLSKISYVISKEIIVESALYRIMGCLK